MFDYIKSYYGVNPEIGQIIFMQNRRAIIAKDCGNYIGVVFDGEKRVSRIHPTSDVIYTNEYGVVPKQTRSQKRYQDWLHSDSGLTFAEYIGAHKT